MTRPRGEIRMALGQAAQALHQECGAFTWVQVAERAQVGYEKARLTVKDMAASGELVRVGSFKPAGERVYMTLFEPAEAAQADAAAADLSQVVSSWLEFI